MRLFQVALEHLLLAGFVVVRSALVLQALAFATATAATLMAPAGAWPAWLVRAAVSAAALSVTLLVTGLLLWIARRWEATTRPSAGDASAVWPLPFGLTLVLLAGLAIYAASPLPALWTEILGRLNGIVGWGDLSRPAPNSGLVVLPILIGLLIPALVTLAAIAAIALPLALLMLLPNRRPRFLALVAMSAVCQAGLAIAGWLAADALAGLVDVAAVSMRDSGEAEVLQVADQLTQASAIVAGTATALLAPAVGLVAWMVVLHPWRPDTT
jgi:hypothetical protein